jgi:hypothetical protein
MVLFTDAQADLRATLLSPANAPSASPSPAAGTGLQLDGVNDYVEVPDDDGLKLAAATITAWIKTSQASGSYPGIVTKLRPRRRAARATRLAWTRAGSPAWY